MMNGSAGHRFSPLWITRELGGEGKITAVPKEPQCGGMMTFYISKYPFCDFPFKCSCSKNSFFAVLQKCAFSFALLDKILTAFSYAQNRLEEDKMSVKLLYKAVCS